VRIPLYGRLFGWFLLTAGVLALVLFLGWRHQFGGGGEWLLNGPAGQRVQALGEFAHAELRAAPTPLAWDGVLDRLGQSHGLRLALHEGNGRRLAGPDLRAPPEVMELLAGPGAPRPGPPEERGRGPAAWRPAPGPVAASGAADWRRHLVTTRDPARHWLVVRLPGLDLGRLHPVPVSLVGELPSLTAGGLLLDPLPWALGAAGAFLLCALLWWPFVRGLTRSIRATAGATAAVAEGRFDVRVEARRRDELGDLAAAVNRMAGRLEGFVNGQKRFLGDVAHELCAPLARVQMSLGILEQRVTPDAAAPLEDLRVEVQQMSGLVHELLSFSKAGLHPAAVSLRPVDVAELARRVVRREGGEARVSLQIDPGLRARTEPELLSRALANLVRNALQHAGMEAAVGLRAERSEGGVAVEVFDDGPGVPPEELPRLFDPFYRVDTSRDRRTGGTGLGLAIVKTCVEACGGTVSARLRQPRGLSVRLLLPAADG
jgi:two-component system sensor histidine kinase CpxA